MDGPLIVASMHNVASNVYLKDSYISVSAHPRLLSTLSSLGCDQKQEAEPTLKVQSFHSAYPTMVPWFNEVTQSYIANGDLNNFISTRDLRNSPTTTNKTCLEKKAPIPFSVESIIGTK